LYDLSAVNFLNYGSNCDGITGFVGVVHWQFYKLFGVSGKSQYVVLDRAVGLSGMPEEDYLAG
jgi:hypothetical protein